MSYLSDYLNFNGGNESPENYHIWSAITLASAVISRKVYIDWGQSRLYGNLYTCLVGRQGLRKTSAKDIPQNMLEEHFPDVPTGIDVSSSQGLATWLASDECTRAFTDEAGIETEYHPGVFFINELKHFLGINPQNMLEFLTDMYDKPFFRTRYKGAASEFFPKPYLVILACETPNWILTKLKADVISGGFARRLIPVFEKNKRCSIPRPFITEEQKKLKANCITMLQAARSVVGSMQWTPNAVKFYDDFYARLQKNVPQDPLMEGFHSSWHTQVLKVAMLLTVVEHNSLSLTEEMLHISCELVDRIVPGMEELYRGAGRNELAQPTERLMGWLVTRGGIVLEKELLLVANRDMDPREAYSVMKHLESTEQIVILKKNVNGADRRFVATKERADSLQTAKKPAEPST